MKRDCLVSMSRIVSTDVPLTQRLNHRENLLILTHWHTDCLENIISHHHCHHIFIIITVMITNITITMIYMCFFSGNVSLWCQRPRQSLSSSSLCESVLWWVCGPIQGSTDNGGHQRTITVIIIVIPRLDLGGSSGWYTSNRYASHVSPAACSARLGQIMQELVELCKNSNVLTFQPFLKLSGNRGNDKTP